MNFQNNKYTLRFANESDNEGIREIFESESFRGNLDVKFLRNPQPYESFCKDGDEARILIIVDNERKKIVAVGGAVIREEYISGKAEKCAYLTGLKIHPKYRKKIFFIAKAYEFLRQSLEDCSFCYTTILNSNQTAIAMFEKQHKNMPHYKYLGQYTTYCFHGGKQKLEVEKNNLTGFEEVLKKYFSKINCTPCNWNYGGFGQKDFYCVRRDNEIIACCFVGNQQGTKQYKMCSYGGIYKFLSHLPTQLMGYPKFPPENCLR